MYALSRLVLVIWCKLCKKLVHLYFEALYAIVFKYFVIVLNTLISIFSVFSLLCLF